MNTNPRTTTWKQAAAALKARLDVDHRNHRMLADPWARAAHCMVQGWRNIISQERIAQVPQFKGRFTTWNDAARSMKASLDARLRTRLLDPTTWKFWAGHLSRLDQRYVPLRNRSGRTDL